MFAIATFLAFTILVAVISWWKTKNDDQKDANVFFLAGRSLPWIVVCGSLLLTNLSTEQLIGLNGNAYRNGFEVMAWEIVAAIALIVMALVFLPKYWAGKVSTVPEFLEKRFDKATRRIVSGVFLVTICVGFLPFVLYSGALALEGLFDVSTILGTDKETAIIVMVWAIGLIGAAYAILGGLEAVAVSDTINGVGLLVGGLLVPILGLAALGDGNFFDGIARLTDNQRPQFDPVGDADSTIPFGTLFTGMIIINIYYWCTNQAIVQRTFGSRSLAEGQKGILATALLKLLGPLYLVLPGVIALELFGAELENGDLAYPMLVDAVLPGALAGLFGAVMFGAILSSFNSALHSSATLFGLDLYKGLIKPNASDQQTVVAGKAFGIALAVVSMLAAPYISQADGGLFVFMKRLAAIFNIPLLAVIVIGMTNQKTPAIAAKLAILLGAAFYIYFGIQQDNHIFGYSVNWLHLAGLNFALLLAFLWIYGQFAPRAASDASPELKAEEAGWRHAKLVSTIVAVLTVALYAGLHLFASR